MFDKMRTLPCLLALLAVAAVQEITPQDVDAILKKADALFEEAKSGYDDARAKNSVPGFVDSGFKLEEARFKYLVVQEIGSADNRKLAADRLRAVQQLGKLIRESKLAVSAGPAAPAPPPPDKPGEPPAKEAAPAASKPAAELLARLPVPDAAKQKEAEKSVRDLFKSEYAKKAPADRQALAAALLDQAARTADDPSGRWVLYREAQEIAVQAGDPKLAVAAVDGAARVFDIDALAQKNAALTAIGKTAKRSAEPHRRRPPRGRPVRRRRQDRGGGAGAGKESGPAHAPSTRGRPREGSVGVEDEVPVHERQPGGAGQVAR
jgi:hypothetical protein